MKTSASIALICLSIIFSGCDKLGVENTTYSEPKPTPPKIDSVAELKKLSLQVSMDKYNVSQADITIWEASHGESTMTPKNEFRLNTTGIDVQKTDSLVSPLVGYIYIDRYWHMPGLFKDEWIDDIDKIRLVLAWQNEKWVTKSLEYKNKENIWKRATPDHPNTKVVKRACEKLAWQDE